MAVLVYAFTPTVTPPLDAQRALIVGAGEAGHELAATFRHRVASGRQQPGTGYEVLGYIDDLQSK